MAINKDGQDTPLVNCAIRLTFKQMRTAKKLGGGNLSAGVRLALDRVIFGVEIKYPKPK